VVAALVEGNSINSTVRMTGISKPTILRLIGLMGEACQNFHDARVHGLNSKRVQVDEIWSFVHSKEQNVKDDQWGKGYGDVWTWVALDADSKLVINWHVGGRDQGAAQLFVTNLAERLNDRIQLTSDGWGPYREAVKRAFGTDVDYAMLVKEYAAVRHGYSRYSPPACVSCHTRPVNGNPAPEHISTSYIERQNLTMRMGMRRFTRLTNAFSKKIENHKHAIAIYTMHYNFCRKHMTIKQTPAMEAGLADHIWSIEELIGLLDVSTSV
jgi:IS1 family transposase